MVVAVTSAQEESCPHPDHTPHSPARNSWTIPSAALRPEHGRRLLNCATIKSILRMPRKRPHEICRQVRMTIERPACWRNAASRVTLSRLGQAAKLGGFYSACHSIARDVRCIGETNGQVGIARTRFFLQSCVFSRTGSIADKSYGYPVHIAGPAPRGQFDHE